MQPAEIPDAIDRLLPARSGHFQFESGHHGDTWRDLDAVFTQPAALEPFAAEMARRLAGQRLDAVAGPMTGGAFLAQLVALRLEVGFFPVERCAGPPVAYRFPAPLRPLLRHRRVAIVDDVINAGSAVRATLTDLRACDGVPAALACLLTVGAAAARLAAENQIPFLPLAARPATLWRPAECPLCARGIPLAATP